MFTITLSIILITAVISITGFRNGKIVDDLIFWPPAITKKHQYYRFITCGLIHADYMHLIFNMLTLYFFGRIMEVYYMGMLGLQNYYYLALYIGALIFSNIPTYIKHRNDYNYRSLGASGAVSAVLFAFILLKPWQTIYLFYSGSRHYICRIVPGLFCFYVQKGRRSYQPRRPFLRCIIRYYFHHHFTPRCGKYIRQRTKASAFRFLGFALFRG